MVRLLITATTLLLLGATSILAQPHQQQEIDLTKAANQVFDQVEEMPQFPGGEAAMFQWLACHIKYPVICQENNIQGRVVVQFVVCKDGSVGQVKVVRPQDPDLDKEAVRVVKSFPAFIPGKQDGIPVNVWYTLPFTFKLQSGDEKVDASPDSIEMRE